MRRSGRNCDKVRSHAGSVSSTSTMISTLDGQQCGAIMRRTGAHFAFPSTTSSPAIIWAPQILKHRGAQSRPGRYFGPFATPARSTAPSRRCSARS